MTQIVASVETVQQYYHYRQLITRFDADQGIMWCYMNPKPKPCITLDLLADVRNCQRLWEQVNTTAMEQGTGIPIRYGVLASRSPGVYSLGGDLELFLGYIRNRDRDGLRAYARMCVEDVFLMAVNLNLPMTTIALVQGDALGGGFEAALSCNFIVAEKSAQFGLPEVLFNLFPGMGGYSMLARKLDAVRAERIITSGSIYGAEEMHRMGVVDLLAEDGEGETAVQEFVARHSRRRNAYQSIVKVRQLVNRITLEELLDIAEIWVDAALNLGPKDLRVMERLVKAQEKTQPRVAAQSAVHVPGA